jgi:carbonic anhydrase
MERLINGFRRFHRTYYQDHREVFDALALNGQSPRAMVIACSDSRADPQLIFGSPPGEMFVVRNVANLVPPYAPDADHHGTSAALEFAVHALSVEHIIVMGHTHCGGVDALLKQPEIPGGDFISNWMSIAQPARERALAATQGRPEDAQRTCEHETIKVSLANLKTFPWIRERVERGDLALHGWHFDLETGNLLRLGSEGAFEPVAV